MNKIVLLISGLAVGIVAVGLVYALVINPRSQTVQTDQSLSMPSVEPTAMVEPEDIEYQNESGFMFSYPGTLELEEKVTDSTTYADVMLTSPEDPNGSINFRVTDTKLKTIADWLKQEKITSASATIATSDIADLTATSVTSETKKQVVAVDQGVLYVMTVTYGQMQDLWDNALMTILDSFSFELASEDAAPTARPNTSGSSSDIIDEGEEVVE